MLFGENVKCLESFMKTLPLDYQFLTLDIGSKEYRRSRYGCVPRVVLSQKSLGLALILVTDQGLLPVSGTELTVCVHASSTIHKGLFTEHFDMMSLI